MDDVLPWLVHLANQRDTLVEWPIRRLAPRVLQRAYEVLLDLALGSGDGFPFGGLMNRTDVAK